MYYLRALITQNNEETDENAFHFVASTDELARDNIVIRAAAWSLDNYLRNPVVLWAHDYNRPPIGRATPYTTNGQLRARVVFDENDPFAREVARKYREGYLHAVSVGWITRESHREGDHEVVTKAELLDISAVPVPGDPNALIVRYHSEHARKAIPPHTTPKAPEDTPWDASEVLKQIEGREQLRLVHAWYDENADPDVKAAYKLPHHLPDGRVVWRGVAAAMARLFQSDTQIPDRDRRGVYAHLARHYRQFDREPPEFHLMLAFYDNDDMLDKLAWLTMTDNDIARHLHDAGKLIYNALALALATPVRFDSLYDDIAALRAIRDKLCDMVTNYGKH